MDLMSTIELWIIVILLVVIGMPFLLHINLKFEGSSYSLSIHFFQVKIWEKNNNLAPKAPKVSKAPKAPESPALNSKQGVKGLRENRADLSDLSNLSGHLESSDPSPWKLRILRAVLNLCFLRAIYHWSFGQLALLLRIFKPSLQSLEIELRTKDPLLLAHMSQISILLKPVSQMPTLTLLYGTSAWMVRTRWMKRFYLAQFIYLGLKTIFGFPWIILWRQWRLARHGPLKNWEEQLVQMTLQQMKSSNGKK